jgi:hypothetical protein
MSQQHLFESQGWEKEWQGMPEFNNVDLSPYDQLIINFASKADRDAFSKLIGQTLTKNTQSVWFPKAEIGTIADKRWVDES